MYLKELLVDISYILVQGSLEIDIQDVHYDSRTVKPGSLFVAIQGYQSNGNSYIHSAVKNGAVVIVSEETPEFFYDDITFIYVENSRRVLSKLGKNYYHHPSSQMKVIGVTGTNGKTSTCLILYHILNFSGNLTGFIGTIGNYYNGQIKDTVHTTPEATTLHKLMFEMQKIGVKYVVMEVSSHSLKLHRVADIAFKDGIFTNLTQDHLDFHNSMEEYFLAKKKLFTMTQDYNVVNIDDEYGQELSHTLKDTNGAVVEYSIKDNSRDINIRDVKYTKYGMEFVYKSHQEEILIECPIIGTFMLYNVLAAIAMAQCEEIPLSTIKKAIKQLPSVPGRLEKVHVNRPYQIYIDYAHTPDGLKNVLQTLKEIGKGRIITLFGCGGDRDRSKRRIMGKIAGELSDFCIITSDNPRSENPEIIIQDIVAGINDTQVKYNIIVDRYEAIKFTLKFAKDNDLILLAGKGHETYQVLKDRTITFDEKNIIKEILEHDCD